MLDPHKTFPRTTFDALSESAIEIMFALCPTDGDRLRSEAVSHLRRCLIRDSTTQRDRAHLGASFGARLLSIAQEIRSGRPVLSRVKTSFSRGKVENFYKSQNAFGSCVRIRPILRERPKLLSETTVTLLGHLRDWQTTPMIELAELNLMASSKINFLQQVRRQSRPK